MFRGAVLLSLDVKGRVAVPTKHRLALCPDNADAATNHLVLTAHPHRCLLLYPQQAWSPIESKLMSFSSFDMQSSGLQRLLVGHAEDVELRSEERRVGKEC